MEHGFDRLQERLDAMLRHTSGLNQGEQITNLDQARRWLASGGFDLVGERGQLNAEFELGTLLVNCMALLGTDYPRLNPTGLLDSCDVVVAEFE